MEYGVNAPSRKFARAAHVKFVFMAAFNPDVEEGRPSEFAMRRVNS